MGSFDRPVLVVDDSEVIRTVLSDMLERFGLSEIVCARDAQEAIALYETHRPQLVFLDITMPEVPGTRVANHILKADPQCKVVLVTAVSRDVDLVESVISAGVYDYLRKPVRQADLEAVLKRIVAEDEGPGFRLDAGDAAARSDAVAGPGARDTDGGAGSAGRAGAGSDGEATSDATPWGQKQPR